MGAEGSCEVCEGEGQEEIELGPFDAMSGTDSEKLEVFDVVRLAYGVREHGLSPNDYLGQPAKFADACRFLGPYIGRYEKMKRPGNG
jgi:hypothetical protein